MSCAVMYNKYMTEVNQICEHGMVIYILGKRRYVPIPLKLTANLDKNEAVKRRERERNDDLQCTEARK